MARVRLIRTMRIAVFVIMAAIPWDGGAIAGPWAQPGDSQLRSDVDILAGAGVIDNLTTHWPLPWASLLDGVSTTGRLSNQPDYVRDAAARLRARGLAEVQLHKVKASVTIDAATSPNFIRGFDGLGRQNFEGQVAVDYLWKQTAIHIALGAKSTDSTDHPIGGPNGGINTVRGDRQIIVPDGSYIAHRLDDMVIYAGYLDHWWGPGWISALSLSTNARPIPQVGIARAGTAPFESPWLSWLGPWQIEFFVGVLDGPRVAKNTIYDGLRFAVSPIPHLEIAVARTDQMCGSGHPCKPIKGYFNFTNQDNAVNIVNDQGAFDIRYSDTFGTWAYEAYAQFMNEDSSPIAHSGTSHLFGGSIWLPFAAGTGRLTVEYTDSVATRNIWGQGTYHGFSYNNGDYSDGMRYRGRTLGFSLDSDSRLLSVQANYTDKHANSYTLTLHHAEVSTGSNSLGNSSVPSNYGNVVTTAPVMVNMVEARVGMPFEVESHTIRLDLEARVQDDQPRPDHGFLASLEARVRFGL
jgi:hypothetical protein